jgi:hypothetical protein
MPREIITFQLIQDIFHWLSRNTKNFTIKLDSIEQVWNAIDRAKNYAMETETDRECFNEL